MVRLWPESMSEWLVGCYQHPPAAHFHSRKPPLLEAFKTVRFVVWYIWLSPVYGLTKNSEMVVDSVIFNIRLGAARFRPWGWLSVINTRSTHMRMFSHCLKRSPGCVSRANMRQNRKRKIEWSGAAHFHHPSKKKFIELIAHLKWKGFLKIN